MNFEFSLFNNPVKLDLDLFKTDPDIETPVLDTKPPALAGKEIELPEFKAEDSFVSSTPEIPSSKPETPSTEEEDPWLVETSSTKIIPEESLTAKETPKPESQPRETQPEQQTQIEFSTIEVDPDLFKVDENQTSIFETGQIDINDPNLKWEISDIKIDALKFDPNAFKNIDYAWVESLQSSNIKFVALDKTASQDDPRKMNFTTLRSTTEELLKSGSLTDDQREGLNILQSDLNNISTYAKANKLSEDQVLELRKKAEPEKYENYFKLIEVAREQNSAASIFNKYGNNSVLAAWGSNGNAEENPITKEFYALSEKLKANQYSSKEEKAEDLKRLISLQKEIKELTEAGDLNLEVLKASDETKARLKETIKENQAVIEKDLEKMYTGYDKEIQELQKKSKEANLSREERKKIEEEIKTLQERREKVKNSIEKLKGGNFDEFAEAYAQIVLDIADTDPDRAEEIIDGIGKGEIPEDVFAESQAKYGSKENQKLFKEVLNDIFSRDLYNVNIKNKDSYIRRNGGLFQVQQDLNLSNDVTNSLRNEMRSLYTGNDYEYNRYYSSDSASSRYYNNSSSYNGGESSVAQYTPEELSFLDKANREIVQGGVLLTTVAANQAIRDIMNQQGVDREIAEAIYYGKDEVLERIAINRPEEGISYLKAASLSSRADISINNNTYNTLGISIS